MSEQSKSKLKNWVVIVLAVINAGFLSHFFGFINTDKDRNNRVNQEQIEELKESRDYYKKSAREYENLKDDIAYLKSTILLIGALDNDLPLILWLKDLNGRMLYVSKEYERLLLKPIGKTAQDYIGRTDVEFWGEEIGSIYRKLDLKTIREDRTLYEPEPVLIGDSIVHNLSIKFVRKAGRTKIGVGGISIPISSLNKVKK